MIINLLSKLSNLLRAEGIQLIPSQLYSSIHYILTFDNIETDPNLEVSLKPILVNNIVQEESYHKAWENLKKDIDLLDIYNILSGKSIAPKKDENDLWKEFQKLQDKKITELEFQNSVIKYISEGKNLKQWEKEFEKELKNKFNQGGSNLENLVDQGIEFSKKFDQIKKEWSKIMKHVVIQPKKINTQDKQSNVISHRPIYVEGYRANLWGNYDPKLLNTTFENLTSENLKELREVIRMMAERLRIRLEGENQKHTGKLNLRKMIKISHKTLAEPIRLIKMKPKRKIPKWIILCDVSGSVKTATKLLFSFLFEMKQIMIEGTRGYVFVDKIKDITEILNEQNYDIMIDRIYNQGEIEFRGYSDYGIAFQEFHSYVEDLLFSDTILLIIGDARNNKRFDQINLISNWRSRSKKILWFNPDIPEKWNTGDSVINKYAAVVDGLYDISTPNKLLGALEKIII